MDLDNWALAFGVGVLFMTATRPTMAHFRPSEFGIWYPVMDANLLRKLDHLREIRGHPIHVSPDKQAKGRATGDTSQHDIIHGLGTVKAVDVFPAIDDRPLTRHQIDDFLADARAVGFTGIGVYVDTQFRGEPWPMVHLDVRDTDHVATWGRIDGEYTGLRQAVELIV